MRWFVLMLLLLSSHASAQISPPGLGEAESAAWLAGGVRQRLDTRHESMSYVGLGAIGRVDHLEAPDHPAILVVNEELYDKPSEHWTYSLALSYRRQNEYEHDEVHHQQELRFYGRGNHVLKLGRFKLTSTLRPEARTFYGTSFAPAAQPLQLRFRLREQLVTALDRSAEHRLIASAEVLASVSRGDAWSDFAYRESRFCLYYAIDRDDSPVVIDIGYMNDLIGRGEALADVHYFAFDVTWKNPFG